MCGSDSAKKIARYLFTNRWNSNSTSYVNFSFRRSKEVKNKKEIKMIVPMEW
jgi:hypothetical protein